MFARTLPRPLPASAAALAVIPTGASIDIRFKTEMGSEISLAKDAVEAVGLVKSAKSPAKFDERADLEIEFSDGKVAVLLFE
jgi:hypothetical protein